MNGNGSGIVPTVDLATNNNNGGYGFAYPVMPMMYGGYGYGNNSGFGFGGEGIWALILLAVLFGGFNGNGFGNNGWNNLATTDDINSNFIQRDITGGLANTNNLISNGFQNLGNTVTSGFSNTAQDICNLRSDVLENRYANQLAECQTQRDLLMQTNELNTNILSQTNELNTNLLTQALTNQAHIDQCCCDIERLIRQDGDETRALITQNTIQDLRDRLTAAKDVISDQRTESNLISALRPYPVPAYLTGSPYVGYGFGFNNNFGWNNGFYGNGFFGNTIV